MTTVLLVRHGRTNANATGILAGRTPGVALDDVGLQQVGTTAERIASLPIRAVASSPLQRCRQTARAIATARTAADSQELTVETDTGLIECGYGSWTGRKLSELTQEKLWQTVQRQPSAVEFPDGEAMLAMSSRAVSTVRRWDSRIAQQYGDDALWVAVSHGDVIKAILADALGMHLDAFQRIMVDPASISVVHYASTQPFVLRMNSVGQDLASLVPKPPKPSQQKTSSDQTDPAGRPDPAQQAGPADQADGPQPALGGGLGAGDL